MARTLPPRQRPRDAGARASPGRCSRKPWPTVQSSSRASASWRLVSIPTATAVRPASCASAIIAATIARVSRSRSKVWISAAVELEHVERQVARQRDRGVARAEVVERDRHAEARAPRRASRARARGRAGRPPRSPPGTARGRAAESARAPCARASARSSSVSSRAETLTEIGIETPWRRHAAACAQAVCSTQSPICTISSLSSARGRNVDGSSSSISDSSSPSGCQRTSASQPTARPPASGRIGW